MSFFKLNLGGHTLIMLIGAGAVNYTFVSWFLMRVIRMRKIVSKVNIKKLSFLSIIFNNTTDVNCY